MTEPTKHDEEDAARMEEAEKAVLREHARQAKEAAARARAAVAADPGKYAAHAANSKAEKAVNNMRRALKTVQHLTGQVDQPGVEERYKLEMYHLLRALALGATLDASTIMASESTPDEGKPTVLH